MIRFIENHRDPYGVEPICRVLPIAPSSYYEHARRIRQPETAPPRVHRDAALKPVIKRVWKDTYRVYGAPKVWRQINREGIRIARAPSSV